MRERLGAQSTRRLRVPFPRGPEVAGVGSRRALLAPDILGKLEREVSKHRKAALDPAHPEALHRMRLAFKKYRYAAEVLLPLFPKATEETAKRLHAFQTLLGTIHDCDVILAEAASFRRDILGRRRNATLEIAFRRSGRRSSGNSGGSRERPVRCQGCSGGAPPLKLSFRFAPPTRKW